MSPFSWANDSFGGYITRSEDGPGGAEAQSAPTRLFQSVRAGDLCYSCVCHISYTAKRIVVNSGNDTAYLFLGNHQSSRFNSGLRKFLWRAKNGGAAVDGSDVVDRLQ